MDLNGLTRDHHHWPDVEAISHCSVGTSSRAQCLHRTAFACTRPSQYGQRGPAAAAAATPVACRVVPHRGHAKPIGGAGSPQPVQSATPIIVARSTRQCLQRRASA